MPYHWYATTTEKKAVQKFNSESNILSDFACYSSYGPQYRKGTPGENGENFYFCYNMPFNITDALVGQINTTFSNIKVRVVDRRPLYTVKSAYGTGGQKTPKPTDKEGIDYIVDSKKSEYILFTVEFNPAYSDAAKFNLTIFVAQMMRMYCPQSSYNFWTGGEKVPEDPIAKALEMNTKHVGSYGALSNAEISKDLFLTLDDIDLLNDFCETYITDGYMPKATGFFANLKVKVGCVNRTKNAKAKKE